MTAPSFTRRSSRLQDQKAKSLFPMTVAAPDAQRPMAPVGEVPGIAELLENILMSVPPLQLFQLQEVCQEFNNLITGSIALLKLRLEAALRPLEPGIEPPTIKADASVAGAPRMDFRAITPYSPFTQRLYLRHLVILPFTFDAIVNGGGQQFGGEKQVPELHFTLDALKADTIKAEIIRGGDGKQRHCLSSVRSSHDPDFSLDMEKLGDREVIGDVFGYKGKRKIHDSRHSWTHLNMTTDLKPFDIMVWVFLENGDFYKHVARFGLGRRTLKCLFDVLTDVFDRSLERHQNEAQLATWYARC